VQNLYPCLFAVAAGLAHRKPGGYGAQVSVGHMLKVVEKSRHWYFPGIEVWWRQMNAKEK